MMKLKIQLRHLRAAIFFMMVVAVVLMCVYNTSIRQVEELQRETYNSCIVHQGKQALYNCVEIDLTDFPPRMEAAPRYVIEPYDWPYVHPVAPIIPPYLQNPPEIIGITTGRQLFVDSLLVDMTSGVNFVSHSTESYKLLPFNDMIYHGGFGYDAKIGKFYIYYGGRGRSDCMLWRTSSPSYLSWTSKPECVLYNSNGIFIETSYVLQDPYIKTHSYILSFYSLDKPPGASMNGYKNERIEGRTPPGWLWLYTSTDGIDWQYVGHSGISNDHCGISMDLLNKKYIYVLKENIMAMYRTTRYMYV